MVAADPPRALWALVAALLAPALFVDGAMMLAAPLAWFGLVPGVAATGPFNQHFVEDAGAAYVAAAVALGLAAVRLERIAALPAAAFLVLHALVHLVGLSGAARMAGIFVCAPPERAGLVAEALGVYLPALAALALVVPARWQQAWSLPPAILRPVIEAGERRLGVKIDYVAEMSRLNWPAFVRMGKIASLTEAARPAFDVRLAHMAALAAAQNDDCGECVQIHLNLAARDGVARDALQAALDERPDRMEPRLALAWRFGRAVAVNSPEGDDMRRKMEGLIGLRGRDGALLSDAEAGAGLRGRVRRAAADPAMTQDAAAQDSASTACGRRSAPARPMTGHGFPSRS